MTKWSLLFLLVPLLGVAVFAVAGQHGWSLPENVSTLGKDIDHLYYMILWVTGLVFIGTQAGLIIILIRFDGKRDPSRKSVYSHGNRQLEILWTIIPAAVLAFVALYQMPAWVQFRFPQSRPKIPPMARVVARQFEWRISYPGPDGVLNTVDDIHVPNELHIAMGKDVLVDLRSMDVLHSFFLPHLRVKQDAVPGMGIPVWFDALKSTRQFQSERAGFRKEDFDDLGGFVLQLKAKKRPVDELIVAQLSDAGRDLISSYTGEFDPDAAFTKTIIADLNALVQGPLLYDAEKFKDVKLSEATEEHLALMPGGVMVPLLNQQIIEDAYAGVLNRHEHHYDLVCAELCGWGHYKMKGRLVVHETQAQLDAWMAQQATKEEAAR